MQIARSSICIALSWEPVTYIFGTDGVNSPDLHEHQVQSPAKSWGMNLGKQLSLGVSRGSRHRSLWVCQGAVIALRCGKLVTPVPSLHPVSAMCHLLQLGTFPGWQVGLLYLWVCSPVSCQSQAKQDLAAAPIIFRVALPAGERNERNPTHSKSS